MNESVCPECGAVHLDDATCETDFHQLLAWESEDPQRWEVHHLTVLCYHLQHPSLYSPETLTGGLQLLTDFVEGGVTPGEIRRRNKVKLSSTHRKFKITGTVDRHGAHDRPILWTMRAVDVVAAGPDRYCESVRAWARAMQAVLKIAPIA